VRAAEDCSDLSFVWTLTIQTKKADKMSAMQQKVVKWLSSRVAGIIYWAFSLVFLWMTTNAVLLYDSYPELFGDDHLFIIGSLFIAAILWYILSVFISVNHISEKRKKLCSVFFVLFSAVYAVTPMYFRPALFYSMVDIMKSHLQSIL
jgi:hypothetical protein